MISVNLQKEKVNGDLILTPPDEELADAAAAFAAANPGKKLLAVKTFSGRVILINPDAVVSIELYK